ncbi:hypothetical protein CHS0354_020607 [Potamilus streckersoni]|uniref:Uncharacterized protein n=1 Tax=Potamilus streckersoni TaxID=2493646 RepID=A0AAE0RR95_9BIVA|nr:hypothetical protein CHS0354_020607 [Potamilus streckersoni]
MFGTLDTDQKLDWKSYIGPLIQTYKATKRSATGLSFLRLSRNDGANDPAGYLQKLQQRMQYAYRFTEEEARTQAARNKDVYYRKPEPPSYNSVIVNHQSVPNETVGFPSQETNLTTARQSNLGHSQQDDVTAEREVALATPASETSFLEILTESIEDTGLRSGRTCLHLKKQQGGLAESANHRKGMGNEYRLQSRNLNTDG